MALFRKRKDKIAEGFSSATNETFTGPVHAQEIGQVALGVEDPSEQSDPRPYAAQIRDRVIAISTAQRTLLEDAVEKGVPQEELPQLVADAMNNGTLPKILRGDTFRGSGQYLQFLDGEVTPDVLSVHAGIDDMRGLAEPRFTYEIGIKSDPQTFTIETSPKLPQVDQGEPVDLAMLAKIDAHMSMQPPTE